MEVHLKVLVGRHAGQVIRIAAPKFLIGRAEDCQLRPHSELVSRHHCALIIEGNYVEVRDFGSKNGTFVNDERVLPVRELKDGDILRIGPLKFEVHLVSRPQPRPKRPKVSSVREAAVRSAESPSATIADEDVNQWLSSDEAVSADHPTRTMVATDETANFTAEALLGTPPNTEMTANPAQKKEEKGKEEKPSKPAEPFKPTISAESSEEAAAEVLRRLRRLR